MEVKLINYTPNPDKTAAAAAFTSWKKLSTKKLFEELSNEEAFNFLKKVLGFGHVSVTEHASFTFSVEGISRACSHQLVRHRIASYTQQSQRYVKFKKDELEYVIPPSVKNSKFRNEYHKIMEKIADLYQEISVEIPVEDARYILPNASYTNIVITMNARELNYFFNMRLCTRAQWEIRELAERMLKEVKPVAPILFEKAGPNCEVLGYCPEGDLSCGKVPTKQKLLKS